MIAVAAAFAAVEKSDDVIGRCEVQSLDHCSIAVSANSMCLRASTDQRTVSCRLPIAVVADDDTMRSTNSECYHSIQSVIQYLIDGQPMFRTTNLNVPRHVMIAMQRNCILMV